MDAPPPPPPMGTGGPQSGGGPPLPPDELLRQALVETAPNPQLAEMAKTAPIEQLKSMLQQGGAMPPQGGV